MSGCVYDLDWYLLLTTFKIRPHGKDQVWKKHWLSNTSKLRYTTIYRKQSSHLIEHPNQLARDDWLSVIVIVCISSTMAMIIIFKTFYPSGWIDWGFVDCMIFLRTGCAKLAVPSITVLIASIAYSPNCWSYVSLSYKIKPQKPTPTSIDWGNHILTR